MNEVRSEGPAWVLPETAALIPVKPQTPESISRESVLAGRKVQPYPFPDDFSQFVLLGQLCFQQAQNRLCRQLTVGVMRCIPFPAL